MTRKEIAERLESLAVYLRARRQLGGERDVLLAALRTAEDECVAIALVLVDEGIIEELIQ